MSRPGDPPQRIQISTGLQWSASEDSPEAAVCVGPKYQDPYSPDFVHRVALGYELMGENCTQTISTCCLGSFGGPHHKPLDLCEINRARMRS